MTKHGDPISGTRVPGWQHKTPVPIVLTITQCTPLSHTNLANN